jgi:hypothetical protein
MDQPGSRRLQWTNLVRRLLSPGAELTWDSFPYNRYLGQVSEVKVTYREA